MESADRHTVIIDQVRRDGHVEVARLAQDLGTSEITIRRDLEHLAAAGLLRRVRGGAVDLLLRGEGPTFSRRARDAAVAKGLIAQAAAAQIQDGEAIVLDSGTTTLAVAHELTAKRLTVVPLSLQAAVALGEGAGITLIVPGGEIVPGEQSFTGPIAMQTLDALRFDTAILACCGFSPTHGVTAFSIDDAAIKRAAIARANRIILVADSSKFARTAMAVVCEASRIDLLVTDDAVPADVVMELESLGVEVCRV